MVVVMMVFMYKYNASTSTLINPIQSVTNPSFLLINSTSINTFFLKKNDLFSITRVLKERQDDSVAIAVVCLSTFLPFVQNAQEKKKHWSLFIQGLLKQLILCYSTTLLFFSIFTWAGIPIPSLIKAKTSEKVVSAYPSTRLSARPCVHHLSSTKLNIDTLLHLYSSKMSSTTDAITLGGSRGSP